MANKIYGFIALTGGGTGALDREEIDGDDLVDKDIAIGVVTDTLYVYILDADSAVAESSPAVIAPDTNAGDKRWVLIKAYPHSITDNSLVTIDSSTVATGEYAKFTGNGLESKSIAEVQADLLVAPGTIGGTTPGVVYATMKEIYKTKSADSPLTALQVSRTIVSNYGMTDADCVISLPTAAEGYTFICILPAVRARYFKFRADTNDKIYLQGAAGSDNGYVGVASGYVTGTSAQFYTFKASDGGFDWFCIPIFGIWVAS